MVSLKSLLREIKGSFRGLGVQGGLHQWKDSGGTPGEGQLGRKPRCSELRSFLEKVFEAVREILRWWASEHLMWEAAREWARDWVRVSRSAVWKPALGWVPSSPE